MASERSEPYVYLPDRELEQRQTSITQLKDGRLFPDPWSATVSVDAYWLTLGFVVDEVGEPVLRSFAVDLDHDVDPRTDPLMLADIRSLASQRLINQVVRQGCDWAKHSEYIFRRDLVSGPRDRRRRKSDATMPQLLRMVSELVRKNPKNRTRAVQHGLGVSHRTATRYISEAKEQGYLTEGETSDAWLG
jgi:hypothetical protein